MTTQVALPVAVLIAGGIVAAAIVLTRVPEPVASEIAAAPEKIAEAPKEPAPEPVVVVPQDTPEVRARGQENAARALEAYRARFIAECWAPAAAKQAEPRQIPLTFNMSFSPGGELTGVGISEDRQVNRPDVGTCLRGIEIKLKIPAPGVLLLVEVPFTLP